MALGGTAIILAPLAPLPLIIQQGIAGVSGYIVGLLLIALGLLTWFQPVQRVFFGIVAILLSLASFVTSNFGGFGIGMLLGLVGGALVFAWVPDRRPAAKEDPEEAESAEERAGAGTAAAEEATDEPREGRHRWEPPRSANGGGMNSFVALPLALALVLSASAPADDGPGWPWDWFGPGEEEEETAPPDPAPDPEPGDPAPSASPSPEEEHEEPGDDEDDEDGDEGEDDEDDDEAGECRISRGDASVTESEEEFLEAVRACQAAQDNGEAPDVDVRGGDGRFVAATVPMGLTADKNVMRGARFEGVVDYPTAGGTERYLKLSMDESEFTGAEQWYRRGGATTTLGLPDMTMSGDVVMHVTHMEARILGSPLTFTPDFPPPLLLPYMVVTDLEVKQPLAEADEVRIDGLDQRVES